ncbi:MAG TPA: nicotinate-nucleotide adenylyltransferase [Gemmatimonadales bacterium]|nr:nicotinate-nucleotide adenylyltransferase [Gemmatimonadales bacterium]
MVGLFGGSFDPVHHGHLIVARAVAEAAGLAEVWFVPAREQPFKTGRHGAAAADRAAMLDLAIAGEPGFRVERLELERPGPSYTVDTLRALHAREPGRRFALLVGADAARELAQWREAAALPGLATLLVFARPGAAMPADLPARTVVVEAPQVDISATAVRARVRAGRSVRYLVPDAVAGYVAAHRLYRDGQ